MTGQPVYQGWSYEEALEQLRKDAEMLELVLSAHTKTSLPEAFRQELGLFAIEAAESIRCTSVPVLLGPGAAQLFQETWEGVQTP